MAKLQGIMYLFSFAAFLPWAESVMLDFNWPKIKLGLKRFPHQQSCSHFYLVDDNGDYALKECPQEQSFDYITLTCSRKTLAHCWSTMLDPAYKPVVVPEPFKCPFDWGTYPDINDCSKFFTCHVGIAHHRNCPPSKRFDKVQETCISERKAMCADESDMVEENFICPYTWGAFSYSKDCSKYYECFLKKPTVRTCKPGDLFDTKLKICDRKEEVNCGSRYNPYVDTRPTTTNLRTSKEEAIEVKTESSDIEEVSNKVSSLTAIKLESTKNNTEASASSIHETPNQEASQAATVQSTEKSGSRAYETTKQKASSTSGIQYTETPVSRAYETTKEEASATSTVQYTETSVSEANETFKQKASTTPAAQTSKQKASVTLTAQSTKNSYENAVSKDNQINSVDENMTDSGEFLPVNKTEKEVRTSSQVPLIN